MMNIYLHIIIAFILCLTSVIIEKIIGPHLEKNEPPLLTHKIPLLGHFYGLVRYGPEYYTRVVANNRPPIFTLGIFGTRSYVVNTSQIIHSIQRNAKTLSFAPLIPYVAERIAGLRPELCKSWFVDNGRFDEGMGVEHHRLIHHTLYTVEGAQQMNDAVLAELKPLMDDIPSWGISFGIYKWIVHVISQTSFGAVYGPNHPMNDVEVEKAFWEFENNAGSLLTSVWPRYQARTAWNGRKKLAAGFLKYYQGGANGASTFVTLRRELFEKNGFNIEDIAQFEAGMSTPILSNTAPALFWLIHEIYARPNLLASVRNEISHAIIKGSHDGKPTFTMDVASLKTKCPLLVAAYHEVLRLRGIGTSARRVLEDTIIDNQYLVKKDTLILMPFAPVHAEQKWWGKNPKSFDVNRQLKTEGAKRPAVAFRSFGGAPHLCPGRQVATLEILCIGAMLISRYDVVPVSGCWSTPKLTYTMSGIATPSTDIAVDMKPLSGTDGEWGLEMGDPKLKFSLASN